jgi:chemotaxis protein histidine kinase CheA
MSDAPDYTGRQLGTWRLIRVLGTGAFGSVYLAKNPLIDREAAVKVLHPHLVPNQTIRRRFFDEARAASQARLEGDEGPHPGVVQNFDGDDGSSNSEGLCYIVMERLVGKTLHEILADQGPLSAAETAALGAALADTLAAVHRRGVVHRDLKPEPAMRRLTFAFALVLVTVLAAAPARGQEEQVPCYTCRTSECPSLDAPPCPTQKKKKGAVETADEKARREKEKAEKAARDKAEQERAARDKAKQEKAAQERAAQEQAEKDRAAQEQAEKARAAQEAARQERLRQDQLRQERIRLEQLVQARAEAERQRQARHAGLRRGKWAALTTGLLLTGAGVALLALDNRMGREC